MPSTFPQPRTFAHVAPLLCAVLAAGALICSWQAVYAHGVAAREREAKERETARREALEAQLRLTEDRAAEAQAILVFFQSTVFHPATKPGVRRSAVTLRGALDAANPALDTSFPGRPLIEASARSAVAVAYQQLELYEPAIRQLERAVELRTKALGDNHPATFSMINNLGVALQRAGRFDQSLRLLESVWRAKIDVLGPGHHDTFLGANNLALAYRQVGKPAQAVRLMEEYLERTWAREHRGHPDTLTGMNTLAMSYLDQNAFDKAIPLQEEMLRLSRSEFGPVHPTCLRITSSLAETLHAGGQLSKAEALCREMVALHEAHFGSASLDTSLAKIALGLSFLRQGKNADAESYFRECLDVIERHQPSLWVLFSAKSLLGAAMLEQAHDVETSDPQIAAEKLAAAEPFLLSGHEGLQSHYDEIPVDGEIRLAESLRRLIDLYSAWNKPDLAAKWQAELDVRTHQPQAPVRDSAEQPK